MSLIVGARRTSRARITSQGQISVPKAIRDHLDAGPGDDLEFEPGPDGAAIVRRRRRINLLDLAGTAADQAHLIPDDPRELKRLIGEGIANEVARKQAKIARQRAKR